MYSLSFSRMRAMVLIAPLCTCARAASKMTHAGKATPRHAKDKILHRAGRRKKEMQKGLTTPSLYATTAHEGSKKDMGK